MVITMAKLCMAHASHLGKKKETLNDGNNNGQATHGARKPPGPITNYIIVSVLSLLIL